MLSALAGACIVADARDASACGGCFHMPTPTQVESVVTDHRMVFSISPLQTVLWDQIRYSGNPVEFAWVLPVHPGAQIQLSHDAWIAALDASTAPVITGPTPACASGASGGGGGAGCGSADSESLSAGGASPNFMSGNGVQIVSQDVIGPYESVTLRSSQGEALDAWLTANGFAIPPAIQPTLDAYASEGFDFIALKLQPGEGVRAMQPVRVVTQGADESLPLRMVAAGIGAHVGITLYVLSEGRYHPQNFPDVPVDFTKLTWDGAQSQSNYETLVEAAMTAGDGRGWVTEFSDLAVTQSGLTVGNQGPNPPLADAYASTCHPIYYTPSCDGAAPIQRMRKYPTLGQRLLAPLGDAGASDAGASDAAATDANQSDAEASDAGAADAETADAQLSDAAASDAETSDAGASDGASSPFEAGVADAAVATCGPAPSPDLCDDLEVATMGLHSGDVWVTRLRADLPANALAAGDLRLAATSMQVAVTNLHTTSTYSDPSYDPCAGSGSPSSSSSSCACRSSREDGGKVGTYVLLGVTALAVGGMLRARRAKERDRERAKAGAKAVAREKKTTR